MSDHQDEVSDAGYDTPLPELDDHCRQIPAVQRPDRLHTRRSILNSLYGTPLDTDQANPSRPRTQDDEEAVDKDDHDVSPGPPRSRRPTAASSERRSISPPNSVKAFAEARRRGRGISFAEPKGVERREGERRGGDDDIARTVSAASRRADHDSASLATNKSPEEDVCYPVLGEHHKGNLYIDFDFLETLLESETRQEAAVLAFPSLLPASAVPTPLPVATSDGEFINIPSDNASSPKKEVAGQNLATAQQQHADPNRFSFFSSAWESTIHAAEFGGLILPGESVQGLFSFPRGENDGVWWLDMNNPTGEEIRTICKAFGIHPLTIEDIIAQENREKIELFPSYYFACFSSFRSVDQSDGINYIPFNIYVVVFREGTLSFSFAPNAHAPQVRARISMLKEYVSLSSDWICYALIDDIVDSFAPTISQVEREADTIEDQVFIARPNDNQEFLRRIGMARKNIMSLMRLLGGKADVLRGFTKRCNENYEVTPRMDIALYLGDIQDHVVTMMNNLIHFEKMLSRSHSNYLAQLSIDSITQSNQTNESLTRVTVIATVLVPLMVVCGLFGMNVPVPWQEEKNLNPWLGIMSGIILFAVTCLLVARRMRYI
ncbi:hypothetical protein ACJ41O_009212 [Fusarium nematophilum]